MEKKFAKTFNEKVQELIAETKEREKFYSILDSFLKDHDVKKLISGLRKCINEPKRLPLYNQIRPLIPAKHQLTYDRQAPRRDLDKMRIIRLSRRSQDGLGFSVRGGLEHEVGIYVSEVDKDSVAYKQGLRPGDEIVRLNGFTVSQAIHQEALNLIKARSELVLRVRNVGMLPVKDKPGATLTWKYVDLDPEPRHTLLSSRQRRAKSESDGEIVNLFINVPVDGSLGCSICSGPSTLPGIFVQTVKPGGLAGEAGLEVGDQVLRVNGTTLNTVSHSQAIVAFKSTKHLDLVVQKGAGCELFKPRVDPSVTLLDPSVTLLDPGVTSLDPAVTSPEPPSVRDNQTPVAAPRRSKDADNKRKTSDENKPVNHSTKAHTPQEKADEALKQAIEAIDNNEVTEVKVQRLSTKAEVHQRPISPIETDEKETKSWIFQEEQEILDGKPHQDDVDPEPIYATIPVHSPSRSRGLDHLPVPVHSPNRSPDPDDIDDLTVSTGFDSPPFPEAVTDFRGSPSYETTIPPTTTQSKVLNPKIYRPIEIQSFKDQTTVRPTKAMPRLITLPSSGHKFTQTSVSVVEPGEDESLVSSTSPTYIPEQQTNYRIQKPVLLHPTQRVTDRRASRSPVPEADIITSVVQDNSRHSNDYTRMLTNEQIAGRAIKQVKIAKAGCSDLGIVIEARSSRVLVAEIYSGGAVQRNGEISVGDQLMIVEGRLLVGMVLERVYGLLKHEYMSEKPVLEVVVAKAPPTDFGNEILPRPDYFDIPTSNLDDFLDDDDVEICMYNNDVPVTII